MVQPAPDGQRLLVVGSRPVVLVLGAGDDAKIAQRDSHEDCLTEEPEAGDGVFVVGGSCS
jgi:hypothetical protein